METIESIDVLAQFGNLDENRRQLLQTYLANNLQYRKGSLDLGWYDGDARERVEDLYAHPGKSLKVCHLIEKAHASPHRQGEYICRHELILYGSDEQYVDEFKKNLPMNL